MVLLSIPFNKLPLNTPRLQFHIFGHGNTTMTFGKFSNPGNPDFNNGRSWIRMTQKVLLRILEVNYFLQTTADYLFIDGFLVPSF